MKTNATMGFAGLAVIMVLAFTAVQALSSCASFEMAAPALAPALSPALATTSAPALSPTLAPAPADEKSTMQEDGQVTYFREIFYLDTYIDITLYVDMDAGNDIDGEAALDEAEAVFMRIHGLTDRFDEESEIYRINNAPPGEGPVRVSAETYNIIKTALEYCEQSGGAFDIGLGAVSDLWAFKNENGAIVDQVGSLPDPEQLAKAVAAGGYTKIILHENDFSVETPPGLMIDLGGIAKGYAVREAVAALIGAGIESAVIDAGGNVHVIGGRRIPAADSDHRQDQASVRPWGVGVRHPRPQKSGDLLVIVSVIDKSVVTSGDYIRYFILDGTRYHHILDPSTGAPASASISATIIAEDSALADYLSTAAFVLGPEKGLELVASYPGVEAIIVAPDMSIATSPGFDGEILIQ